MISRDDAECPVESKLWGGRFAGATHEALEKLNASVDFDRRLWREDVQGSKAYAACIHRVGLLTDEELEKMIRGLSAVSAEWETGSFVLVPSDEDIHTANERRLGEIIGADVAGKLHTGRSRNDQVAVDSRLWTKGAVESMRAEVVCLLRAMARRAREQLDVLMPGYTHLQRAQPVRWSHWLMSHAFFILADLRSLESMLDSLDECPLGAGALAGNPFGVDREALAKELGFARASPNSMKATSDRDFILDFLYWSSKSATHLSRLAEDIIIHSTSEFGFVRLADAFCTGSSLMPQKRNPDSLELIRAKAGRMTGRLTGLLTTIKGTPSTYNKDLQEDKECLFDAFDTMISVFRVAAGVVDSLVVDTARARDALSPDMLATDLAYFLVRRGVPFRAAHARAGEAVALAEALNPRRPDLAKLTTEQLKSVHPAFDDQVRTVFDFEASVEQYDVLGGTARARVLEQIEEIEAALK